MAESLGQYLKRIRESKFLTLRTVEERTGISNAYLSQLETGKISQPSPKVLHKIADVYQVSYVELMELAGYPTDNQEPTKKSRIATEFSTVTPKEEEKLLEYLQFLRARKDKK